MAKTATKAKAKKSPAKAQATRSVKAASTKAPPKAAAKPAAKAAAHAAPKSATKKAAVEHEHDHQHEHQQWTPPIGTGTFCWHELFTSNMNGAKAFYSALFGWGLPVMPLGDSGAMQGMIERGSDGIGCLSSTPNPATASHWLSYVQVDDVDASAAKITSLGGQVTTPPVDIPGGHGRYAIAKDPQGATFAVYSMPAGSNCC